jgi:hypothetical protein
MRTGPRVLVTCALAVLAVAAPARAADTLSVVVDNNSIALGAATTLAAHAETDAGYGGGHIAFKFKPADQDCQPTPDADSGDDASADQPPIVAAGSGVADVGGESIQLDIGYWRVCGWLVDDTTGATAAVGSTVVQVVPYIGSISISVKRTGRTFQFVLAYSTSAAAHLFAWVQPAAKQCRRSPLQMPKAAVALVPRGGRFVGSDGGLGHSLPMKALAHGRWRVCSWLRSEDVGAVGPVTKTFSVPRQRRRHAGHAAG